MKPVAVPFALALTSLLAVPAGAAPSDTSSYRVVQRFTPGGEGGWDYLTLDHEAKRLYVARATRVQVLDTATGRLIGEIAGTPGVHGVALAPGLGRGYASNGRDSSVTVFDLKSLGTLTTIPVGGQNPDAILFEPVTKRVFTFNGGTHDATAIDAVSNRVLGRIPVGGRPEFAVEDGRGHVFLNLEDSSAVVGFDARTLTVGSRWPLAPGEEPTGLAIDAAHRRLFSTCGNKLMIVMDLDSGRVVASLPIGERVDAAAFDADRHLVFSSNGEGTLTIVRAEAPDRFTVAGTVTTQRGARTMALDAKSHRIYLAAARFGEAPPATAANPRPRPPMEPGSFVILVLGR
jgi:DNA-binding beta-propeller fold protein YncE